MPTRPVSITVLAIIGIVLGAIGLCGAVFSLAMPFLPLPRDPINDALFRDSGYLSFLIISTIVGTLATIVLVAASIACFKLRPWARVGMIVYAWVTLINGVVGTLFNILYVFPLMEAEAKRVGLPNVGLLMVGSTCLAVVIFSVYPGCILFFFTRPRIIDAFHGRLPAAPTSFPITPDEQANPYSQ